MPRHSITLAKLLVGANLAYDQLVPPPFSRNKLSFVSLTWPMPRFRADKSLISSCQRAHHHFRQLSMFMAADSNPETGGRAMRDRLSSRRWSRLCGRKHQLSPQWRSGISSHS